MASGKQDHVVAVQLFPAERGTAVVPQLKTAAGEVCIEKGSVKVIGHLVIFRMDVRIGRDHQAAVERFPSALKLVDELIVRKECGDRGNFKGVHGGTAGKKDGQADTSVSELGWKRLCCYSIKIECGCQCPKRDCILGRI